MYGTVARIKIKPGMLHKLQDTMKMQDNAGMGGYVGSLVYQMDADANECYMAVVFESKDAYVKNADSPEQDARYREFVEFLEGAPDWHDGEVVFNDLK